jgi:hypothetical protein
MRTIHVGIADSSLEELRTEAYQRLTQTGHHSLKAVACEVREKQITLRGQVGTFYEKQLAQEAIRQMAVAHRIVNEIEVC